MDGNCELTGRDLYEHLVETGDSYYADIFLKKMFPKDMTPQKLEKVLEELSRYVIISSHRELLDKHANSMYLNGNEGINKVLENSPLKRPFDANYLLDGGYQ